MNDAEDKRENQKGCRFIDRIEPDRIDNPVGIKEGFAHNRYHISEPAAKHGPPEYC
ncbi:hypothetical protein SDC9_150953 [bioreactor metagenome]|uniref:Uncharacterized protein n=1 Tax=bioreactor metagenome TaxID=1076179 RepID=A0A645ENZ1_9ZZZZ